ncbi:hypothetical protein E4T48_01982 [Aureobasidium sp. EXF-10727]|nr:hypothetical protein E4T48_01982 [Aureobasidium sp. EXF-10727]
MTSSRHFGSLVVLFFNIFLIGFHAKASPVGNVTEAPSAYIHHEGPEQDSDGWTLVHVEEEILALIRSDPNVLIVAQNAAKLIDIGEPAEPVPTSQQNRQGFTTNSTLRKRDTQPSAPWNLVMLSENQQNPSDDTYYYLRTAGQGVNVYVLDTGFTQQLNELSPRFSHGQNLIEYEGDYDLHGHGTHVAGIVGSDKFGVCKKCNVISVKVGNASGVVRASEAEKGIRWVIDDHNAKKSQPGWKGSVINMSFQSGSKNTEALRRTVKLADDAGIVLVASAGNDGLPISQVGNYPGDSYKVITVAASLGTYQWYRNSNYGFRVDFIAPGGGVESYWVGSQTLSLSGTSQAAPHVAGLAAIFMSYEGTMNTKTAKSRIRANVVTNLITDVPAEQENIFINSGYRTHYPYKDKRSSVWEESS